MLLKNKLTGTHMSNIETVTSYLMKIAKLRDKLAAIRDKVKEDELVQNPDSSKWILTILASLCAWVDFVQEETKLETISAKMEET